MIEREKERKKKEKKRGPERVVSNGRFSVNRSVVQSFC
jgi:hypothetical protein